MLPINSSTNAPALIDHSAASPTTGTKSKPVDTPDEEKLRKAAGDFESILLSSMWKSMKQSFGDSKVGESDAASGTIDDLGIEAMSQAVGKAGGLGIGNMIIKHLGRGDGK
jgi:Rod binding domain-containing protein